MNFPEIPRMNIPKLNVPGFEQPVVLDPDDPFDAALIPIVKMNRKKRKDYAADGDPFSNFKTTAGMMGVAGFGAVESALFNVMQKLARLQSLRINGRMADPANEAVIDTYLDLAVYAIITYALVRSASTEVGTGVGNETGAKDGSEAGPSKDESK